MEERSLVNVLLVDTLYCYKTYPHYEHQTTREIESLNHHITRDSFIIRFYIDKRWPVEIKPEDAGKSPDLWRRIICRHFLIVAGYYNMLAVFYLGVPKAKSSVTSNSNSEQLHMHGVPATPAQSLNYDDLLFAKSVLPGRSKLLRLPRRGIPHHPTIRALSIPRSAVPVREGSSRCILCLDSFGDVLVWELAFTAVELSDELSTSLE